ncbi:MAG: hypothetical protein ACLVJ6_01020 [Merdibacter sp.]
MKTYAVETAGLTKRFRSIPADRSEDPAGEIFDWSVKRRRKKHADETAGRHDAAAKAAACLAKRGRRTRSSSRVV